MAEDIPWRNTMRPVRLYAFDARLLSLLVLWIFYPSWGTFAALLVATTALRIAEARGYSLSSALRAARARAAGRSFALYGWRYRRFADYG